MRDLSNGNVKNIVVEYNVLRVIATLLVVLGHCTYYKIMTIYGGCDYSNFYGSGCLASNVLLKVTSFIYIFHMPLFMALSGALFFRTMQKNKYLQFKEIVADKSKRLLIPFVVVSIIYVFPLKFITGYYNDSSDLLCDFILGQLFAQGNTHLWYCLALFIIYLIVYFIESKTRLVLNKVRIIVKMVIAIALCIVSSKIGIKILSYICEYTFWFYVGYYFESCREKLNKKINLRMLLMTVFITCILTGIYYLTKGAEGLFIKIAVKTFDVVVIIFLCFTTYLLAYYISRTRIAYSRIVNFLSADSFGIYLYSDTWNYVFLRVATLCFGASIFTNNAEAIAIYVIRFFGTLAISIGITELLRKCKLKYLY